MNPSGQNSIAGTSGSGEFPGPGEFEETLRLIARLSAPEGLEDRVQAGLRASPAPSTARILAWPSALRLDTALKSAWLRSAAAAAIVAVVIGGSWGVYLRVQLIQPTRAITVPLHLSTQGGFSSAGARRTPQTLNGPMVEHPAAALPAPVAPLPVKPADKPVLKTPLHAGKTAPASKAIAQPPALPAK
jgi:hypothetical protein